MFYRLQQFWLALSSQPKTEDLLQASLILGPRLYALFERMQPSEQAHSLQVLRRIQARKEFNHDLLAAALLHDCGKSCHPLNIWGRVWIVLIKALLPGRARIWGQAAGPAPFWQQPLIVAGQHANWGADMAAAAGASETTVNLIRRHQDHAGKPHTSEDQLLAALQAADNES